MFKLALSLFLAATVASACQMLTPGTTLTTTTTTVTTHTVSGAGEVSSSEGGLSGSEKALIRSSWEKMRKNGNLAPQILFRFLKAHPQYQKKFALFADVPQENLLKNGNFLAQAFTIMAGVNVVVQSLAVPELLQAEASHLGKTHFTRGVTVPMFEQFARAALDAMSDVAHLSSEELHAWEDGFAALIAKVSQSLKEADEVPHTLTGLSPSQVKDVQRTWANLRGDRNSIVSSIFIKLFGANPSLQSKFNAFDDVAVNDLPANAAFNAQVTLVADRLDSMISVLDKPLKIGGQVRYMAFSHSPRAVLRQEFQDFADLLVSKLSGKGVTEADLSSWKAVLNTMVKSIAKIQGI